MTLIMPIYGTRPEAIKMAPLVAAIKANPGTKCMVAVTGQHREMLDQVNELFGITPDYDLNIIQPRQSLNEIMARAIEGLDKLFAVQVPDMVVVQGDTTTSTAGAIAAFNRGIPVAHLEAGLRSGDILSPFPEEANRKLTSQIAALHLAPTSESKRNLLREGVNSESIVVTGNTVIDALLVTADKKIPFSDERLENLADAGNRVILMTTHRRENQGRAMEGLGEAVACIAREFPDVRIVFPVHKNPAVREAILPPIQNLQNVIITEPLAYGEFTRLMSIAHIVLTDSGGVQEEAPSLGKPVLVMRENTERPEAVVAGTVRLIGTDKNRVISEVRGLLTDNNAYRDMANAVNPYGDGLAAARALAAMAEMLGIGSRIPDFSSN